jgi:FixJ family two-component response regulator
VANLRQGNEVAVVDDDESVRDSTKALLRSAGYRVSTFDSAEQFLSAGSIAETDCLILDIWMPGMNGLELQRRLNDSGVGLPIIFLSAHA